MASDTVVGFIGLGAMGIGMASNLQDYLAGNSEGWDRRLHVYNRTLEKAARLKQRGAVIAESPAELGEKCGVVFCMSFDDNNLKILLRDYLAGNPGEGAVFINTSTVDPGSTETAADMAAESGVVFLSCPVFGRPDAAAAKRLLFLAAGDDAAKAKVRPLLDAMGRGVVDVGPNPRTAAVTKLVGNSFIVGFAELLAEILALGEAQGVPTPVVANLATQLFPGPIPQAYISRISEGNYTIDEERPGFRVTGGLKDIGYAIRMAQDIGGARLPIAEVAQANLRQVEERGGGELDFVALALPVRESLQLPIPDKLLQS